MTVAIGRLTRRNDPRVILLVLTLANALAFVDRQALALFVQPIKDDLGVSDTAMSLLYGTSFTLFYVAASLPLARLADRSNRRNVVAGCVVVWSLATAACGLVRSLPGLVVARTCMGAGEAGLNPAAYSMLADCFPRERLATAMGVYQAGIYVGGAAALLTGGWIAGALPQEASTMLPLIGSVGAWQVVFLALGLPGLLLSAVVLVVREPSRRGPHVGVGAAPLSAFLLHLAGRRNAYLGIGLGFALMILVGNATGAWIPTLFVRKFGWTAPQIGANYGLVVLICGTGGALTGGMVASWLERRGIPQGNLGTALVGFLALVPLTVAFPMVPRADMALAIIGGMNFFAGFNFGGGLATLQLLTPNRMRALLAAGYMLIANVVGATLGPTAVALVTDYGFEDPRRLPEAIAIVCAVASPLAVLFLLLGMHGLAQVRRSDAAGGTA